MFEIIIKAVPLIAGGVLTALFATVISKRTRDLAISHLFEKYMAQSNNGINKKSWEADLQSFLKWRDLITAVLTGLFVLEFSAAEKIQSKIALLENSAFVITTILVPVLVIVVLVIAYRMGVRRIQSHYWLKFILSTVIWYIISFVFVYS